MKERDLRDILKKLDVEVVHKNHRGWLIAHCPFAEFLHDKGTDATPSFNVKINTTGISGYKCHSCHQHGSISALANSLGYLRDDDYNYIALQAAVLEVPESFPDFEEEQEDYEASQEPVNPHIYLAMYPKVGDEKDARAYLQSRGIGRSTAELLDLRYDPEARRVLFPVFDFKRDFYGLTGRSIIPDDERPKDIVKVKNYFGLRKELRLLGEQLIDPTKPLFVVEGLFALAHAIEVGARDFCNPVAPMGSDLSQTQRDLLVSHDAPVFLCFDDDAAGNVGLFGPWDKQAGGYIGNGAIDRLREHTPTFLCYYPERTGDPDELTREEIKAMIERDHERC